MAANSIAMGSSKGRGVNHGIMHIPNFAESNWISERYRCSVYMNQPAFGNRCGHDPRAPQLQPTIQPKTGKGGLPPLLRLAVEKLRKYFTNPDLLPTLNAANKSSRQQRGERRESCVRVLSTLLHRMDIATLRVGVPRSDGSHYDYSIEQIAEAAGLGLKRTKRAIADLKRAGLITINQVRRKASDNSFKSLVAIKTINRSLFATLGLGAMFSRENEKRAKRQRKSQRSQAKQSIAIQSIMQQVGGSKTPPRRIEPKLDENRRRQELTMMGEILEQHPDWPRDKILAHIKKALDSRNV